VREHDRPSRVHEATVRHPRGRHPRGPRALHQRRCQSPRRIGGKRQAPAVRHQAGSARSRSTVVILRRVLGAVRAIEIRHGDRLRQAPAGSARQWALVADEAKERGDAPKGEALRRMASMHRRPPRWRYDAEIPNVDGSSGLPLRDREPRVGTVIPAQTAPHRMPRPPDVVILDRDQAPVAFASTSDRRRSAAPVGRWPNGDALPCSSSWALAPRTTSRRRRSVACRRLGDLQPPIGTLVGA
jgi:hypothetical protein